MWFSVVELCLRVAFLNLIHLVLLRSNVNSIKKASLTYLGENTCLIIKSCILFVCMLSHSVVSNSLWSHGLWPPRLLCPWNSQARILEWVVISNSRGKPTSPAYPALAGGFLTLSHLESPFFFYVTQYVIIWLNVFNILIEPVKLHILWRKVLRLCS